MHTIWPKSSPGWFSKVACCLLFPRNPVSKGQYSTEQARALYFGVYLTAVLGPSPTCIKISGKKEYCIHSVICVPLFSAETTWGLDMSLVLRTTSSGDMMHYQVGLLVHSVCCKWILPGLIPGREEKISMPLTPVPPYHSGWVSPVWYTTI